ncbi:MAG TPA: hypothetical protein DCG34_11050 [Clostridiales bacterium]|jgi:hypothetical protein|nr:hypothetical protein [Clostridiales bacterium]
MKTSTQNIQAMGTSVAADYTGKEKSLAEQTGYFKKIQVKMEGSKAAGEALKRITLAKVEGEAEIALTAINITVATIKTAMVANAMPQIGSLATRLNSSTAAVNQALTNGGLAEVATHMNNREANKKLFIDLNKEGKISLEEQEILSSFAEADAASDIVRSRARTEEARNTVDALHGCALSGITSSQEILQRNR